MSRMSEANPRQSLVKGERLIRYELASAILVGCRTGPRHLAIQSPRRGRGLRSAPLPNTPQGYPPNGTRPAKLFFDLHDATFSISFTQMQVNGVNWHTVNGNLQIRSVSASNGTRPAKRASTHDASEFPPSCRNFQFVPPKGFAPSPKVPKVGTSEEGGEQAHHPNFPQEKF